MDTPFQLISMPSLFEKRRTVRSFTTEAVTKEQVDYLVKCALLAPTVIDDRLTRFLVLTKPESIAKAYACRQSEIQVFPNTQVGIVVYTVNSHDVSGADRAIAAAHVQLAVAELGLASCWFHMNYDECSACVQEEFQLESPKYRAECMICIGHAAEQVPVKDVTTEMGRVRFD